MSSDWPVFELEDCLDALIDYRGKTPKKTSSGIPLITAKIIKNGRIDTPTEFIALDDYDSWMRRGIPERGDIVLTVEAPLGEVAQLGSQKIALAQRVVTLRGKSEVLDSTYLMYWLQSADAQDQLVSRATGTTVIGIKQSELRKLQVPVPPFAEQLEIAQALSALDDRINLLRETNQTLEAIAQAIFKSWFVNFDPVRAKMEGRQPVGMDEDTAALFPDELVESELGLIPRGWAITSVAEVAEVIKGKSYKSDDLVAENDVALVTLKSFKRGGGFRLGGFKPYAGSYKDNQVVTPGDLIVAYTDVTQAADLIGKPAIVIGMEKFHTLVASLDVGIVKPNGTDLGVQYLYGLFKSAEFLAHTFAHTSGTTVLHLAKDAIPSFRFVRPAAPLAKQFESLAITIANRVQLNIDGAERLEALRDTLLPRLISGKLRVPVGETHAVTNEE